MNINNKSLKAKQRSINIRFDDELSNRFQDPQSYLKSKGYFPPKYIGLMQRFKKVQKVAQYIQKASIVMLALKEIIVVSESYSPGWIASLGQTSAHEPQSMQVSGLIT